MRVYRPPKLFHYLYPGAVFRFSSGEKKIYLTFDDGPTPGVSDRIIEILLMNSVPATFFITGRNAESNPSLLEAIRNAGFGIANHGYDHIGGVFKGISRYLEDARRGEDISGSQIFRPAYGAISPIQYRMLKEKYRVVFWDLMPYDFDRKMSPDRVLEIISRKLRPGSVIVLHDNPKSCIPSILSEALIICKEKGYVFGDLSYDLNNTA